MEPGTDISRERRDQYRTLLVIGAMLAVAWVLWSVRGALFPFVIGLIVAYLLLPIIHRVEQVIPDEGVLGRIRRPFSILFVYLSIGLVLVATGITIGPVVAQESVDLVENLPAYWETIRLESEYWSQRYEREVPVEYKDYIEENLDGAVAVVQDWGQRVLTMTFGTVTRFITFLIGLLILPLWLYYVLAAERDAANYFYKLWPEEVREDVYQIVRIVDRILSAYLRGQLFLGIVIGVVSGIGFWLLDIPQPLALGVVAGVLELVPILGPWITFIIAAIVVLATDPSKIWAVAFFSLAVQQLENTFLVPRVQGNAVNMNPAIIMVLLVVGGSLWGLLGVIIIIPLAAILRDVFRYVYRRLGGMDPEDLFTGRPEPDHPARSSSPSLPEPLPEDSLPASRSE